VAKMYRILKKKPSEGERNESKDEGSNFGKISLQPAKSAKEARLEHLYRGVFQPNKCRKRGPLREEDRPFGRGSDESQLG